MCEYKKNRKIEIFLLELLFYPSPKNLKYELQVQSQPQLQLLHSVQAIKSCFFFKKKLKKKKQWGVTLAVGWTFALGSIRTLPMIIGAMFPSPLFANFEGSFCCIKFSNSSLTLTNILKWIKQINERQLFLKKAYPADLTCIQKSLVW